MSIETKPTEIAKREEKAMDYIPFGAKDPIKLSVSIVQRLIAVPTKSGKMCSADEAIKFMMMCHASKLNPFCGDAFLIGYDTQDGPKFSLITAHQAFLKRAEVNPEYDGMRSGLILKRGEEMIDVEGDFHLDDDTILGGWAIVYFKNRVNPMHKRIRLSRFNTGRSQWAKDPAGMVVKCAEADSLRSSFPTLLGGLYLSEELEIKSEIKLAAPIFDKPAIEVQTEYSKEPLPATQTSAPEAAQPEEQNVQE